MYCCKRAFQNGSPILKDTIVVWAIILNSIFRQRLD